MLIIIAESSRKRPKLSHHPVNAGSRRLKIDVTVHGVRAAFRSWWADTGVAFELAEAELAHSSSSIVAAYQRSALTDWRWPVMEAWASFLAGDASATVVAFRR